jgi:hypothetical protein
MEAIVGPRRWDDFPSTTRNIFQALRSPAGEEMVLQRNLFIERILPARVIRPLSAQEMENYRRPFLDPGEGRRPMLTWPREIPIEGEPARRHRDRRGLRGMAGRQRCSQTVHQRGSGLDSDWASARSVPTLAESTGSNCERFTFCPGRLAPRDRSGDRGLVQNAKLRRRQSRVA